MNKSYIILALMISAIVSLSAQGVYFDIGGGLGASATGYMDANDRPWNATWNEPILKLRDKTSWGFDASTRIGYGPFETPLYFVGELSWTKAATFKSTSLLSSSLKETMEYSANHYFFGPGFVYYPTDNFQIGASMGATYSVAKLTDTIEIRDEETSVKLSNTDTVDGFGFGFNLNAGFDLGSIIIGGKLSYLNSELNSGREQYLDATSYYYGLYAKYKFNSEPVTNYTGDDRLGLSVFGGLALTDNSGGDIEDTTAKIGFNGGISYMMTAPHTIIEPGVRIITRGHEYERATIGTNDDGDIKRETREGSIDLMYLDFFAKVKFNAFSLPIYPYFGMYVGYALSAEESLDRTWTLSFINEDDKEEMLERGASSTTTDILDDTNPFDVGLMLGVDYVFANRVSIGLEYDLGLTTISKRVEDSERSIMYQPHIRNQTLLVNLGVLF